jgi:hypothetical protein
MPLSTEEIDAIAEALVKKTRNTNGCTGCSFNNEEREWVHTGAKYVGSEKFPLLGRVLKMMDDTTYEVGKFIIKAVLFMGLGGLLFWFVLKFKGQ